MRTSVSLSATFTELPGLRDLLLRQHGRGVRVEEWQPRSDAVVLAQDAGHELRSSALVRRELDSTEELGTPVFLLSSPDEHGSTAPRSPWERLRGRCVQIARSPRDRVTCLRLVDAIEDHLLHLDPGPEPERASPALGSWLRPDLALAGIQDARGEAPRPKPDHPAEPLWPYERFLELVRRGDLTNALHLLTLPDGATPLEPWPAAYLLGRVRGARGWFDDLASSRGETDPPSAARLLELAYWDLVSRSSASHHQEAAERACLVALVRVSRRSARSEAPQWLRRLEQHVRDRPGTSRTPVVTEQIRLNGRYGVERSKHIVERLTDELWRSPARTERLLASQDLVPVHELADRALVQVVAQTVDAAARSVVQPAPALPQEDLHEAVGAARAFAQTCAEALVRDIRRLDGLVEHDSPAGGWTVDQRERDLQRRRQERDRTRIARDQAAVELARAAQAAGIASELADPLNLPLAQREHDARVDPDASAAADESLGQLVEALDARVGEVVPVKEAAHARRDALLNRDVGPPVPPTGTRLGVGLLAAVVLVVDLVWSPGGLVLDLVAAVLSLVVLVCFLPWVLALAHRRALLRAQDAVAGADADHRAAVAARAAAASVGRAEVERVAAEVGEQRASDRLAEAVIQRDQVAQQLGLGPGRSAAEFAQALRDRLISFNRAFAEPTPFWWEQAVLGRSAADGELAVISETNPIGDGLLSGVPGARLVRAVDDGAHRSVSDLWAVFPVEERAYALAVERRLHTWLTTSAPRTRD